MATWQLDLTIVPRRSSAPRTMVPAEEGRLAAAGAEERWVGVDPGTSFLPQLSGVLSVSSQWADGWDVYGRDDGIRIDVFRDDERIEEVRMRIDVRNIDHILLGSLLDLLQEFDCVFLDGLERMVEPEPEAVCIAIESSPAAAFVQDPIRFLRHFKHRE